MEAGRWATRKKKKETKIKEERTERSFPILFLVVKKFNHLALYRGSPTVMLRRRRRRRRSDWNTRWRLHHEVSDSSENKQLLTV